MEHARPPGELMVEGGPAARADARRKWRKQFEAFLIASGVSKESEEIQVSLLVNLIGLSGYEIFSTFTYLKDESEHNLKCLLTKFDAHFGTKPNITMSRFKFFSRNQEQGETIDQFVTALRLLSQNCVFGDLTDSLIKDRIVCGIASNTVRDRLLRTDDLSLAKAVQQDGARGRGSWRGRRWATPRDACASCGYYRCAGGDKCPAHSASCFVCDKKGHFAKMCVHRGQKVMNLSVEDDSSDELFYVNTLEDNKDHNNKEWFEIFVCNGKNISCKLDTGSLLNVLPKSLYLQLGYSLSNLRPFHKRVHSFTGNNIAIVGETNIQLFYKNTAYILSFVIADFQCQSVIGLGACIHMNLINRVNSININRQYNDLFHGLGKLPGKYTISIDESVQPVVCSARKIPLGMRDKLLCELQRMMDLGVIRKVTHPTNWVNAGDIRLCLDPRPLNRAVRRAHYALPTVSELAARLRGAGWFSLLDARSGFWMIELDDASADLCTAAARRLADTNSYAYRTVSTALVRYFMLKFVNT
ncbi:unnamed protein product [Pieris macdunnoughi]|uniref:CCHC-type domain-containing protein n=1 Tax=Pieris macdunnoughi TaxID=345717 RepID=A0A821VXW4_9NEOP|nr:unnamed protein product [Pieris macdunnoughi]